jgi:hypothetical protein
MNSAVTGSSFQLTRRTIEEVQFTLCTACEVKALFVLVQTPCYAKSPVLLILNHCPERAQVQDAVHSIIQTRPTRCNVTQWYLLL